MAEFIGSIGGGKEHNAARFNARWAELEAEAQAMTFEWTQGDMDLLHVTLLFRDQRLRREAAQEDPESYPDGIVPATCWHDIAYDAQRLQDYYQNNCRTAYIEVTLATEGFSSAA